MLRRLVGDREQWSVAGSSVHGWMDGRPPMPLSSQALVLSDKQNIPRMKQRANGNSHAFDTRPSRARAASTPRFRLLAFRGAAVPRNLQACGILAGGRSLGHVMAPSGPSPTTVRLTFGRLNTDRARAQAGTSSLWGRQRHTVTARAAMRARADADGWYPQPSGSRPGL